MEQVIPLRQVQDKTFRKQNVAELFHKGIVIKFDDWLDQPENFKLASKSCDGSIHLVNSEIADVLVFHRENIRKGKVGDAIRELTPMDPIHGDRLVLFLKDGEAFLLGNVESALLALAGK